MLDVKVQLIKTLFEIVICLQKSEEIFAILAARNAKPSRKADIYLLILFLSSLLEIFSKKWDSITLIKSEKN